MIFGIATETLRFSSSVLRTKYYINVKEYLFEWQIAAWNIRPFATSWLRIIHSRYAVRLITSLIELLRHRTENRDGGKNRSPEFDRFTQFQHPWIKKNGFWNAGCLCVWRWTSAVGRMLVTFSVWEFVRHRSMTGEHDRSNNKNRSLSYQSPKLNGGFL
jgi:hypothetical protein